MEKKAMDWFSWLSKTSLESSLVYDYGIVFSRNELQMEDVAHFNHEFLLSMGVSVAKHRLQILKLAKKENEDGDHVGVGRHRHNPRSISKLGLALLKTKKCFSKYFTGLAVVQDNDVTSFPKHVGDHQLLQERYREHWRGALVRKQPLQPKGLHEEGGKTRSIALSGPLDMRTHERLMMAPTNPRSLKLSGPLDSKVNERLMYTANRSPRLTSGPVVSDKTMVSVNRIPKIAEPHERPMMAAENRSPKLSGPLDGRVNQFEKERMDLEFDEHSLWTALFHDMKPT